MIKNEEQKLVAFILTNGRPDRVYTYSLLRDSGYTGPIYLIIDDLDKTRDQYLEKYGDQVIVFPKKEIAKTFDNGDNFYDMRAIIYARNACFEIAKKLGIKYFIQLDDDYIYFTHRYDKDLDYFPRTKDIFNLDKIFDIMLQFYIKSGALSFAWSQGGDFIGGSFSKSAQKVRLKRKCMNSFICSIDRPFTFVGRINEDVNTYTKLGSMGNLFLTTTQVSLGQKQTQTNKGGMTELYLDSGTYVKSFYSVMYHPSSVTIRILPGTKNRLHHHVKWKNTVPLILSERLKKI